MHRVARMRSIVLKYGFDGTTAASRESDRPFPDRTSIEKPCIIQQANLRIKSKRRTIAADADAEAQFKILRLKISRKKTQLF
jgi:hypothetical protein